MQLRARPPRRPSENIVPLINVVFLLLVFFMLTGTLAPPEALNVRLPVESREVAATPRSAPDTPRVSVSASGELAFEGLPVSSAGLDAALVEGEPRDVALRADAGTPSHILLPLLERLQNAGVQQVDLVTDLAR
jgi:biopolymer transport protein ExbD